MQILLLYHTKGNVNPYWHNYGGRDDDGAWMLEWVLQTINFVSLGWSLFLHKLYKDKSCTTFFTKVIFMSLLTMTVEIHLLFLSLEFVNVVGCLLSFPTMTTGDSLCQVGLQRGLYNI
jgi:hypothetical protein